MSQRHLAEEPDRSPTRGWALHLVLFPGLVACSLLCQGHGAASGLRRQGQLVSWSFTQSSGGEETPVLGDSFCSTAPLGHFLWTLSFSLLLVSFCFSSLIPFFQGHFHFPLSVSPRLTRPILSAGALVSLHRGIPSGQACLPCLLAGNGVGMTGRNCTLPLCWW